MIRELQIKYVYLLRDRKISKVASNQFPNYELKFYSWKDLISAALLTAIAKAIF
jgi:hypothetical protein